MSSQSFASQPVGRRSVRRFVVSSLVLPFLLWNDSSVQFFAHGEDFSIPQNTEKATTLPSTPDETVASAQLPTGFQMSVFAAEPDVHNPIAMTTDERGRLWVAENYSWSGNNFGNFDGNVRDRILIFEDTDGDGRYDQRKVFADDLRKLTSIEVGNGGVWIISLPNVLFIPDKDRDDTPDGPAEVVFDGIDEGAVGHTPANGLKWGPDGWMYARHGILATSNIGQPGASDSQRIKINTGVWRFHPVTKRIETVMHGMTNAWGYDFDQHGEMYVINTVIGHLWHVVPGAHVERMFGVDINPNSYQLIGQTADHVHWDTGELWSEIRDGVSSKTDAAGGGHAHIGLMIYQGDNWPEEYRNRLYTLNLHGRRLNSNVLERQGTAYVGKRAPDLCFVADPWFRGMELLTGADGGVFLTDWSDTGECHDHDGVHRTSGRIYKLTYGQPNSSPPFDLNTQSDSQLVALLANENTWWARQARRILTERYYGVPASADAAELGKALTNISTSGAAAPQRLRALETLFSTGLAPEPFLISLLSDSNEHVQVAALRFLLDGLIPGQVEPSNELVASLMALCAKSDSGLVDLYLASGLQRLPLQLRIEMTELLSQRDLWKEDRSFPKMLWYGFEPTVAVDPEAAIRIAASSQVPLLTENIARRITQDLERNPQAVEALVLSASKESFGETIAVVRGMAKALAGWQKAPRPAAWEELVKRLESMDATPVESELQTLQLVFGDGKAVEQLIALAGDAKADPEARRQAVRSLAAGRVAGFDAQLLKLIDDRVVWLDAIRGLAFYDQPLTPQALLDRWGHLGPYERKEVVNTLATRPEFAKALMKALSDKRLSASDISAFHARQMHSFEDAELSEQIQSHWGNIKATGEEKKREASLLHAKLTPEFLGQADLSKGRALFQQNCANCHVLYGVGKNIGPDITGSNRSNIDYLLENILDPSASVGAEFRTVIVLLEDDRVVNGVIVEQTDRTVTIQTAQEREVVDRREIESMKQSTTSLMPDGLLQNLSDDQIRDLFAYLMHTSQVSMPDGDK